MKFNKEALDSSIGSSISSSSSERCGNSVTDEAVQCALFQSLLDGGKKPAAAKPDDVGTKGDIPYLAKYDDDGSMAAMAAMAAKLADDGSNSSRISKMGVSVKVAKKKDDKPKRGAPDGRPSTAVDRMESKAANVDTKKPRRPEVIDLSQNDEDDIPDLVHRKSLFTTMASKFSKKKPMDNKPKRGAPDGRPSTAVDRMESKAANVDPKKPCRPEEMDTMDDADADILQEFQKIIVQLSLVDGCDENDDNVFVEGGVIDLSGDDDDAPYVFQPSGAGPPPDKTPAEKEALYQEFMRKLDEADDYYFKEKDIRRGDLLEALKRCFQPNNLKRGDLLALAQGKCGVPEGRRGGVNFEGFTAPNDDTVFSRNASIQGATSIANALPPNGTGDRRAFQYTPSNRLRVMGLNCRFGCKSTKTQHGEHCDEPDEIEARVSVLIACATIEYLIAMGTFVLYLNFGGLAVKGLMEDVRRNLRRLPDAHRACVVAKGTHMYRIHYCVGDPREQADSVTRHMMNMSDQIDSFMRNVVNPIRVNERKRRFKWQDGAMMNKLYDDDNAVCVVSDFHQASVDNLYAKSHQQAVARGHMAAEALRKKYGDNCYQMLGRLSMETQAARYGQT
eukprot:scaffold254_cov156-Skeletonema_menzelii.AAC.1